MKRFERTLREEGNPKKNNTPKVPQMKTVDKTYTLTFLSYI